MSICVQKDKIVKGSQRYQELLRSAKIFDSALLPAEVHESPKKNHGVTDLKRYSRCVPTYYSTQKKSCFDPAPSLADQATETPVGTSDLQFHDQNENSSIVLPVSNPASLDTAISRDTPPKPSDQPRVATITKQQVSDLSLTSGPLTITGNLKLAEWSADSICLNTDAFHPESYNTRKSASLPLATSEIEDSARLISEFERFDTGPDVGREAESIENVSNGIPYT